MLTKKGEVLVPVESTGVSWIGQIQWEREKARRAALQGPSAVDVASQSRTTEPAVAAAPVQAAVAPVPEPALTESERVERILGDPEAVGRLELACHLAETDTPIASAIAALRLAPRWESETVRTAAPGDRAWFESVYQSMAPAERVQSVLEARAKRREVERQAADEAETIAFIQSLQGRG